MARRAFARTRQAIARVPVARRACTLAALVIAACAAPPGPGDAVRIGDQLVVRASGATLVATRTYEPDALAIELDGATALSASLTPGPLGWALPDGDVDALHLTTLADGAPTWLGALDGVTYRLWLPEERAALAGALDAAGVGPALRELLPHHRRARAWLPESRAVFAIAALADPTTTIDPASWPALAAELDPPGRLPGDRAGVGMTCSTAIRCPAEAPICVTATHEEERGFCTRACLDDRECDGAPGRCGFAVSDIPDVPRGVTACYAPDGDPGAGA